MKPAYLEKGDAAQYLAISESTLERLVRQQNLPQPRLLSGRRTAFLVRELDEWAESRPVSDLPPPPNTGSRRTKAAAPSAPASRPNA
ncbi:helix-turn-helix domain-containing protein [Xylophilus sp. Leaf220]|uniref:helix-turn-helix transcriptional regulator n=1 Tax=Xylophilus sp. Leaf220 TaxID=1735686 RepID=UPI0009E75D3E